MTSTLLDPADVAGDLTARGWAAGGITDQTAAVRVAQGILTGPVRVYTDSPHLRAAVDDALTCAGWVTQEVPGSITGFTVTGRTTTP